jgi:catalase
MSMNKPGLQMARLFPVAVILAMASAVPAAAAEPEEDLPVQLVDSLHSAFGEHHARAVHAKGIVLTGTFMPDPAARTLSKASVFAKPTPVTVRFSDFTGIPTIPDNIGDSSPRGLAIKFGPVDDAAMDIVTHGFNGFPVKTATEFGELMRAIGASGSTAPKPTALDKFLGAHPIAVAFLTHQSPPPESYAAQPYFGVNAFTFTNAKGQTTPVRYRFIPVAGAHFLDAATAKAKGPDYLKAEIAERVSAAPIRFGWYAQIGEAGDKLDDPSIAWPETRRLVKLGTISITKASTDQAGDDKRLIFLPGNVPDGISPADPMVNIRTAAYPVSFSQRQ